VFNYLPGYVWLYSYNFFEQMHMLWLAWIYEVGSRGIVCATFSCKVMPLSKLISGLYVFCLIIPSVCFHFANWFNIYFLGRTKMTRSREYISRFFVSFATVIYAQLQLFCFQGDICVSMQSICLVKICLSLPISTSDIYSYFFLQ
jgi:hypothetical protein